jgi:hypothetical protein
MALLMHHGGMRRPHSFDMLPAMEDADLVGLAEIPELLGVRANTVVSWRQRGVLPEPTWRLKSGPIWRAQDVQEWYEREKGSSAESVPPDRIAEAIDLTAEPGRAEVFAHYGLAMAEAQIVEQHLVAVLALLGIREPYSSNAFMAIIEREQAKTMGQLKAALQASGAPILGVEYLKRVVTTRNLLAHHYFGDADRSIKMRTETGRCELIAELDSAARQFHLTAGYLRASEVRLALNHGVTKDTVIERVRALMNGDEPRTTIGRKAAALAKAQSADSSESAIEEAFES